MLAHKVPGKDDTGGQQRAIKGGSNERSMQDFGGNKTSTFALLSMVRHTGPSMFMAKKQMENEKHRISSEEIADAELERNGLGGRLVARTNL